jgi:hypothetical protein
MWIYVKYFLHLHARYISNTIFISEIRTFRHYLTYEIKKTLRATDFRSSPRRSLCDPITATNLYRIIIKFGTEFSFIKSCRESRSFVEIGGMKGILQLGA